MANGWAANNDLLLALSQVVGASQTNSPVTKEWAITAGGAVQTVLKLKVSAVTVGTAITAKIQSAIGDDWVDSKTVSVSGNGTFYIKLLGETAGDQSFLPLLNKGRLVITTGAGDTVTVDSVGLLQPL